MSSSLESLRVPGRPTGAKLLGPGGAEAVVAQALERARAEGYAAAEVGQIAELSERIERALQASEAADLALRDQFAQAACELAVVLAERLVCATVDAGAHDVEGLVRRALSQSLPDPSGLTVRLHPSEALALSKVEFSSEVRLAPDKSLQPGDVLVESSHGRLVRSLREMVADLAVQLPEEFAQ
jgi:flagellar biosynthesis/type III secretory pathway protein FliH